MQDVLRLNEGISGPINGVNVTDLIDSTSNNTKFVHLLPIIPSSESEIVSQVEMKPELILQGMMDGARAVLKVLGRIQGITTPEDIEIHLNKIFPMNDRMKSKKKKLNISSPKLGIRISRKIVRHVKKIVGNMRSVKFVR